MDDAMKLKVEYARDEAGWWVASVPAHPGCFTQGKTLRTAERRIREALGLFIGPMKASRAELEAHVTAAPLAKALAPIAKARARVQSAQADYATAMREAMGALRSAKVSTRDAAKLLGISGQRVGQRWSKTA